MSSLSAPRLSVALLALVLIAGQVPSSRVAAGEPLDKKQAKAGDGGILWYDALSLGLEGQGWTETAAPYDRLPAKAEGKVRPPVWNLSRNSAGMAIRFVTASPEIHARWTLTFDSLAMVHMPATGKSGLDLYVLHEGQWRWLGLGRPTAKTTTAQLVSGIPAAEREYMIYLPLYNGVSSVEIGIPEKYALAKASARPEGLQKPLLFYGTSITQGGCASRTGMVHTSILGRQLNRPVLNLGFSGNGKMEPELAELLAELDPAVYVLDCLPNMNASLVRERVEPFVKTLRAARPNTPILLVEDRFYSNSFLIASKREHNEANHRELKAAYDRLQKAGIEGLFYLKGEKLLGAEGNDTVDGSHPTDLGFLRQADAMRPVLESALGK